MSLVTTPTSQLVCCARCGATRVTALAMTLTDGSRVEFASCHICEYKSWRQGGADLPLDLVLTKARKAS